MEPFCDRWTVVFTLSTPFEDKSHNMAYGFILTVKIYLPRYSVPDIFELKGSAVVE